MSTLNPSPPPAGGLVTSVGSRIVVEMSVTACWRCGITYMMPADYVQKRREDGRGFWCPNGHANYFRDSDGEQRRKADALRKVHEEEQAEARETEKREKAVGARADDPPAPRLENPLQRESYRTVTCLACEKIGLRKCYSVDSTAGRAWMEAHLKSKHDFDPAAAAAAVDAVLKAQPKGVGNG